MKTINVPINVYEKGDRVLTAEGMATVKEDEELCFGRDGSVDRLDLAFSEVPVELDESCSRWTGRHGKMEASTFMIQTGEKDD